jgi:large repetitive protein
VTSTAVTVVVPIDAQTGPVKVTNAAGQSPVGVQLKILPRITSVVPASVLPGSVEIVTVSGDHLQVGAAAPVVKIGALVVIPTSVSATQIEFLVPVAAVPGPLTVTTVDGTATAALLIIKPPTITAFTPVAGRVGTIVTVTGTNFLGVTDVLFNGTDAGAPVIVSATSIRATVPAGASTGKITVTDRGGSVLSSAMFTVTP